MTTDKVQTVKLYFEWSSFRPDQRAYRQQEIDLFPALSPNEEAILPKIEVEVPLEKQYIANCEAILAEPINGNPAPAPILTLKGMRYIVDLFDDVFYATEAPEDTTSKEDDWGAPTKEAADKIREIREKSDMDEWNDGWGNVPAPIPVAVGTDDEWAESTGNKDDKWDETTEVWE